MCINLVRDVFRAVQLKRDVFRCLEKVSSAIRGSSLHHRAALQLDTSSPTTRGAEKTAGKLISDSCAPGRVLGSRSPLRNITNGGSQRENESHLTLGVVQERDGEGEGDVSIEGMEDPSSSPKPGAFLTDSSGSTLDASPSNTRDNNVDSSIISDAADLLDELSSAGLMLRDLCLVYLESLSKARGGRGGGGEGYEGEEGGEGGEEDEARECELSDARRAILETILMAQEAEAASRGGGARRLTRHHRQTQTAVRQAQRIPPRCIRR